MKIALLHALPFDERLWEPQLAALADHELHTPRLYDLGSSMDEWALGVLQEVPGQFVVVGASMGGYCGGAIARLAPERLRALVLTGSRADADPADRRPVRDHWIQIARERGAEAFWEEVGRNFFSPAAEPAIVERGHQIVQEQDPDGLVRAIEAIRDRPDSTEAVTSGIPLLIVHGEEDQGIPVQVARDLAASAPHARIEVLEGCGHLPNMERPEEFNRILTSFLATV
ncbi:MAG TPA: alpha/beta hydrolase [Gaiellaceae bacterium]|nr:alpha/beta hydrolase [Gaiellaceae bacterium]